MSTSHLGLGLHQDSFAAPAAFIAWNWFYAYVVLATRHFKQYYGIDHQASPRQDLKKYGEIAVREGKMTQAQLDQIYRVEAASANSTEGFILFTASGMFTGMMLLHKQANDVSVLFGMITGVPSTTMKTACTVYTISRTLYGFSYVFLSDDTWAISRVIPWYAASGSCLYILYKGAYPTA